MEPKISAGFGVISMKMLKTCINGLSVLLTSIINKSFPQAQGIFPSKLKAAKVYPKFKKGDPTREGIYRSISLLPAVSKVIEKIVLTRLTNHHTKSELLPKEQHDGFIANRLTTTAVIGIDL